ncbi:urotensin-2 isoform X1 [Lepidochelys kempii]|uniref:urotensin-2 isoform X1 n=1 Tax=Lepidochelys kempii TaxID=8472 RepID=UPI003C6FC29E
MEGGGSAVVTCTGCAMFVFLPQDRSDFVCTKCKLVSILEEKIEGLEQQITTLHCIRETEDFLDKTQDRLLGAQSSTDIEQVAQRSQEASEEAWQHVTSRRADENTRLNVERLDSLGRASLLQTLPRLLGAQTEDSPSKAGLSPSSYNPRENVKEAFYGSHPRIALLSRLLAKDRKQNKKRGNLSECFWKYCV